jgi:lipopolysaccharide/colanic/teichoic acid biosynthesis glycosyltransferase
VNLRRPRRLLFLTAGLDLLLFVVCLQLVCFFFEVSQPPELLSSLTLGSVYLLMGWLFGSYTILRWPSFQWIVLLRCVGITVATTLIALVFFTWCFHNPSELVFLDRRILPVVLLITGLLSLLLRRYLLVNRSREQRDPMVSALLQDSEGWLLLEREWLRTPDTPMLRSWIRNGRHVTPGLTNTISHERRSDRKAIAAFNAQSFALELAERQLERLPPSLLPHTWIGYADIPWASPFSLQRQLKRAADLSLSLVLLIASSPLLAIAMMLIWLEDRGPIFFTQKRTGWMGQPFQILKLRTMRIQHTDHHARWTSHADQRITFVGRWLRRLRIDELPQLFNVIAGDMSLIGPRPERPEIDDVLEKDISHYRKRYWMRPGLSGWAQVCSPYAASVEEAELKLSYDLFYLCHFSTALDLLILFKTIKTVLKAKGR